LRSGKANYRMKKFVAGVTVIPVSGQVIHDDDVAVLHDVVDSRWYTDSKQCAKFRRSLGKQFIKSHVVLTNSGSSASLVAMSTAVEKIERDSHFPDFRYVLTTALAFPTTVAPIYQVGKIPLYVDIDPKTLTPDMDQVYEVSDKLGHKIAGAIFTHTLGFPFDESKISPLFNFLISDGCDSIGTEFNNFPVGTFSNLMTLSFFPAHHITSGEGGAVLTNLPEWAAIADSYVNWGRSCYCNPGQSNTCGKRFEWETKDLPEGWDHKYIFDRLGYNLKMTEFQAALGNSQLSRIDEYVLARRENFDNYLIELDKYSEYIDFVVELDGGFASPFGFPIIVKDVAPFTPRELIMYLEEHKITTRRFFGGNLTRQPAFSNMPYQHAGSLIGTDYLTNNAFWIGVQPSLTDEMKAYVVQVFEDFFKSKGL